jgi:hypothetical protein
MSREMLPTSTFASSSAPSFRAWFLASSTPGWTSGDRIDRDGGRWSWTIVWSDGTEYSEGDRFLRAHDGSGTQRAYAYVLVDHLRWLERECLSLDRVGLRDLQRYTSLLAAEVRMPLGQRWREENARTGMRHCQLRLPA